MTNILFISYGHSKLKSKLRKEEKSTIVKKMKKMVYSGEGDIKKPINKNKIISKF